MAYDPYDTRHRSRGEHDGWQHERHQNRGRGREERGFFERAGDEIASWFGDDERSDRDRGERPHGGRDHRERSGQDEREWFGGRSREEQRGYGWQEPMSRQSRFGGGSQRPDHDRHRDDRGYRPRTGDYGRSEQFRGGYNRDDAFDRGSRFSGPPRPDSKWEQDDYRRTSFVGSRDRSQHHDPHYQQWRERQLSELDRDYEEYHRERQSRFEDDFGSWRERRQQKRQMIGQVREHMEVVGKDGEHVGTVDKTAGDRIILTRSDPQAGGAHHSISCNDVDRVENNRVLLDCTADEAKKRWRNEDRSRALFEREGRGEDGPHMLDRSFSGTYRD